MAAPKYTDRLLASEVRSLTLKEIRKVLQEDYTDIEFKKAVILKLASTVLPRINEHTGEEGGAIIVQVAKEVLDKNDNSTHNTSGSSEGQEQV
jgi:hypothetical protein